MIEANTIKKELLKHIENLMFQANFNEFANYIDRLTNSGYRTHITVNPNKSLCITNLKQFKISTGTLLSKKENLYLLVRAEKSAAIRSQDFDYVAQLRSLENGLDDISVEEAVEALGAVINLDYGYSIAIHLQDIYIAIQSEFLFIKNIDNELIKIRKRKYSQRIEGITEGIENQIEKNASLRKQLEIIFGNENGINKAFVAYVSPNGANEIIYFQPISNSQSEPTISLQEHLTEINCSDIRLLTLLCTHYIELDKPLMPYIGIKHPIIDTILFDSLGWLAYTHQLDSLFTLATGINDKGKINIFVEHFINNNRREIDSYLCQPVLDSTLGKIIDERMLTKQGRLKIPNYFFGVKLLSYLNR